MANIAGMSIDEDLTRLRVLVASNIRLLVEMANDKGILQGDIVSINKFDEQYFLFYYN